MDTQDPTEHDYRAKSDFVRTMVQRSHKCDVVPSDFATAPPRAVVQYWHDIDQLPADVLECIDSWRTLGEQGFDVLLFDDDKARDFILRQLGPRYEKAYQRCYHPAMRSDYFRLCYILVEGGCYLDADDVRNGLSIEGLFSDGRLRLQPLCYDVSTHQMVPPSVFTEPGANASSWIFYFNNNPLIAGGGHPVVERALSEATIALERAATALPEIQSTTGPGNLTKAIVDLATEHGEIEHSLIVLRDWEAVAATKWPLSYRQDARNWRLSNQRSYLG